MIDWKDIKIEGISKIDKCAAEFDVWAVGIVPYAKFKVKVFEGSDNKFTGYTNLRLKSLIDGSPEGGVGFGNSVNEALEDTVKYFMNEIMEYLQEKGCNSLTENDIEYSDPDDF